MATHDHRLQKIRDHVQDAHEELRALPAEDRQAFEGDLARLNDIVDRARAVLAAADPRLVSTRAFASIQSAARAISDDPRGALRAPDAHVDALADALALLPVTRKELEHQVTATAEHFHQSRADRIVALQRKIEAEAKKVRGLASELGKSRSRLDEQGKRQAALDKKLAEAEKTIAKQAAAVDEQPQSRSEPSADGESARIAELRTQVDSFRADLARAQQEAIDELRARVTEQGEKQAALDEKLAEAEETFARQAAAIEGQMGVQSAAFAEGESARTAEFQAQLDSFRADLARAQQEAIDEVQARVAEIRRMEQETADLVGAIGLQGAGEIYRRHGRGERRAAAILRGLAVLAGVGAVAIAFAGAVVPDATVESLTAGLFASLLLAGLAAYLGVQAGRHRAREERASALQLELAAFGPFIEPLSPERREEERVIMARKLFPAGNAAPVSLAPGRSRKDAVVGASNGVPDGWALGSTPDPAPAETARAPAANGAVPNASPR